MDQKLFDKLPSSFVDRIKTDTEKFISTEMNSTLRKVAIRSFNEALWKLRPRDWVLERVFRRTFVARQINVIQFSPENDTNPEDRKNGLVHLLGDQPLETVEIATLTDDCLYPDLSSTEIFPILESVEKTMQLFQALYPNQAVLLVKSNDNVPE